MKQQDTGIKKIYFDGNEPALGYTDFSVIYISSYLSEEEDDLVSLHESAHIWLQHQRRTELLKETQDVDMYTWNVALDLEIAKYIYTPEDNDIILKPRSLIQGGITTRDTEQYSDCRYAEDFYAALLKQASRRKSFDARGNIFKKSNSQKNIDREKAIYEGQLKATEQKEKNKETKKARQIHAKIRSFQAPKPTLASEIDRYLGRNKIKRVKSYRRPARRSSSFLLKGAISRPKTPTLTVYVDRSGSFSPDKTEEATARLHRILKQYRGKVKKDVVYFNDTLLNIDPMVGGGGTNYQAVVDDIARHKSLLSVVITDDDSCAIQVPKLPEVLVVKIGCSATNLAKVIKANEVI